MQGEPDIKFLVKEVDYGKLADEAELQKQLTADLEKTLANDLDNVDESQVTVRMAGGVASRLRRLAESGSLMVDVYVDGDKSSIVPNRDQEEKDVHDVLLCNGDHSEQLKSCCATEEVQCQGMSTASSMTQGSDQNEGTRKGNLTMFLGILGGLALLGLLGCLVFQVWGQDRMRSQWATNPPECIIVPGGGLSKDGTLVPWVQERLRRAHQIYMEVNKIKAAQGSTDSNDRSKATYIVTMCEGIRYSPRDPRGNRTLRLESQLSAEFLKGLGVASEDLITDDLSLDTMGNAYFLRTTHTGVFRARSLAVITNEFHFARTKTIFEKIFKLGPFPDGNESYTLRFDQVKNLSIDPAALKRRHDWEKQQLLDFEKVSKDWRDLHDVHAFIFSGEETNHASHDRRGGALPHSFTSMKM
jgi:uncharacterized SAM-binding protein YcdF (DUF218 family)